MSAPVLALPNFNKPFCIETDDCHNGIGAVLLQDGHPLAFMSRPLGPKSQGLSTYEKEYMAILMAVEQWRTYLLHQEFIIYTDQRSLIHLNEQRLNTAWQQKVFTKLLGKGLHKKGADNRVADALSRRAHESAVCLAISSAVPQWCEEIIQSYSQDTSAQQLLSKLTLSPSSLPHYTLDNGIIKFHNRIWLGSNPVLHEKVLHALHGSAVGGHSGIPVTYRRVKQLFAWPGLKKYVQNFVSSCVVCQQAKSERVKYPGFLEPLSVPQSAWQMVSMDFVEGLPCSSGKNCILVIVDKFSKFSHFVPLSHPFTAVTVAKVFMQQVYRLHSMPTSIVSDRDKVFTSRF